MTDVAANVERARERIVAAGGDLDRITIVAATKQLPTEAVHAAVAAGVLDIGENYAQQLLAKVADGVPAGVRWHFLGAVQRNKVKALAPVVSLWHGVDRVAAVDVIAARAPGAPILVEVNTSGEAGKAGCGVGAAADVVEHARAGGLEVRGLMTVAPLAQPAEARAAFRRLAELRDELGLVELSMGMSGDLEIAVEEGATIVRLGTALFGPRPVQPQVRR